MVPVLICRRVHQQQASMFQTYLHRFNVPHLAPCIAMLQYEVPSLPERERRNGHAAVEVLFVVSVLPDVVRAVIVPINKNEVVLMAGVPGNEAPQVLQKWRPGFGRQPRAGKRVRHSWVSIRHLFPRYFMPLAINSYLEEIPCEIFHFRLQPLKNVIRRSPSKERYVIKIQAFSQNFFRYEGFWIYADDV